MQLVLLATAVQRGDGSLMPLPDRAGDQADRAKKAVEQLIKKGLPPNSPARRKPPPGAGMTTRRSEP